MKSTIQYEESEQKNTHTHNKWMEILTVAQKQYLYNKCNKFTTKKRNENLIVVCRCRASQECVKIYVSLCECVLLGGFCIQYDFPTQFDVYSDHHGF